MSRHVHVIGAGLAGLAAALRLSAAPGVRVTLSEATAKPGGRCRSFEDAVLGRRIDNGNHLMLSGNRAVRRYLDQIGAADRIETLAPRFAFRDLASGQSWDVRIPRTPLGLLGRSTRPPGAGVDELAGMLSLLAARRGQTVADAVRGRGALWDAFWVPMTVAVMNAPPEAADARLLARALGRTFLRGAAASRPMLAPHGLGEALVAPAVARLGERGVAFRWRAPLRAVEASGGRAAGLDFARGGRVTLGPDEGVVLALPPAALAGVLPGVEVPPAGAAIANAHFVVPEEVARRLPPILGVISGRVHWVFRRGDVLSTTTSGVRDDPFWTGPKDAILATLWSEVAQIAGTPGLPLPRARLLTERWATFDQSPAGCGQRLPQRTRWSNLVLAGDHVDTGLPATIEGALRSGFAAAETLLGAGRSWPGRPITWGRPGEPGLTAPSP